MNRRCVVAGVALGLLCLPACGARSLAGDADPRAEVVDSGSTVDDAFVPQLEDGDGCTSLDCSPDGIDAGHAPEAAASPLPCGQPSWSGPVLSEDAAVQLPSVTQPWPPPPGGGAVTCLPSLPTPGISCCMLSCCPTTGSSGPAVCLESPNGAFCCNPRGSTCVSGKCCPSLSCISGVCM